MVSSSHLFKVTITLIIVIFIIALSACRATATTTAYTFESPSGNTTLLIDENCGERCAHNAIVTTKPTANSTRIRQCTLNTMSTIRIFDHANVSWSENEEQIFWRSTQSELQGEIDIQKDCVAVEDTFISQ